MRFEGFAVWDVRAGFGRVASSDPYNTIIFALNPKPLNPKVHCFTWGLRAQASFMTTFPGRLCHQMLFTLQCHHFWLTYAM